MADGKRLLSLEGKLEPTGTEHTTPRVFPNPHNSVLVKPEPEVKAIRSKLGERGRFQEEVSWKQKEGKN